MSEIEDAIVQARRDVLNEWAICAMSEEHERDKWEHICAPDAEDLLARLERLVRYAALWEAHGWTTCTDEECSLEAEIAEAVK